MSLGPDDVQHSLHLARLFDALAATWDREHPVPERLQAIARGLDLAEPLRGARVMDVGCGTGILLPFLMARIGPGRVVAMDLSPEMVARARRTVLDERVRFLVADAMELVGFDGVQDVVLCFDVFPHFQGPVRAVKRLARLLAPGGRLVIWHDLGREALAAVHRVVGGPVAQDVLPPVEELAALCEQAGLHPVLSEDTLDRYTLLAVRETGGRP